MLCIRASSRVLPVVPMFHVNAWGMPYAAALTGASLVLPGRHLDGASMASILNSEAGHLQLPACPPSGWVCCSICGRAGNGWKR